MGLSRQHASTIPLVLNIDTGYITPQFHVVFDDWFATVATTVDSLPDFNSDAWTRLFGDSIFQYPFDADDLAIAESTNEPPTPVRHHRNVVDSAMNRTLPPTPLQVPPPAQTTPQPSLSTILAPGGMPIPSLILLLLPREPSSSTPTLFQREVSFTLPPPLAPTSPQS